MKGTFFGLDIAVRGLYTAQRNLDVVSHNINNINTPGYSRQQGVQSASRPVFLNDGTGMLGTGSEVTSIKRIRDEYLDFKYWSENIANGEWSVKKELLSDLETTFNEPSDSGFTKILNDFFSSLQELSKDPGSPSVRALVREKGVSAAKYFNSIAEHFEKLQSDVNYRIMTKVEEVNSYADQIRQLNKQIYTAELDGNNANDLRDKRGLLVDKLSKLVNIEVNEVVVGKLPSGADDRHFVISVSGKALVDHFNTSKLSVSQRETKLNEEDVPNLYQVGWEDGNTLNIKGGELKGYLDIRDGNNALNGSPLYKGIPYYMQKLNQFVRTFAMAFNEGYIDNKGSIQDGKGHADGYGLDPDGVGPGVSSTGIRFFTMLGADGRPLSSNNFVDGKTAVADIVNQYKKLTAKNFAVSSDVIDNISSIAASGVTGEIGNIDNLNELIEMRHNPHMFDEGAPEDFMKSMVSTLGIDSQQAVRYMSSQSVLVKQIDNRRLSDSGVSIDEEMTNLVKFQHAYNAAAKMVQTMSEVYDTLINRIGLR